MEEKTLLELNIEQCEKILSKFDEFSNDVVLTGEDFKYARKVIGFTKNDLSNILNAGLKLINELESLSDLSELDECVFGTDYKEIYRIMLQVKLFLMKKQADDFKELEKLGDPYRTRAIIPADDQNYKSKYRIIKKFNEKGQERYYVQKKIWFFWFTRCRDYSLENAKSSLDILKKIETPKEVVYEE